ncbi:glycosyltransferase [uncultured Jatrophihabitans sp.]|uniref:glycosyltransferase n=1 Tax=uncultured Jatrophihabitans sp. TaxID=1610747 RepID=UPI0035CAEB05
MVATGRALVAAGTVLSVAGAVHATVNARLLRAPAVTRADLPLVSVLVPARDEAAVVGDCVSSVGAAREVLVLDDESTDATAERAREAGARVVPGAPVPPGWLGKPWACAQLVEAADPSSEVLVFLDADVRLEDGAIDAAVSLLLDQRLDIVCPFPRQLACGPAERLVQPLLQWSWLTTLPLRLAERSPRASLTAACGQFLVVRRDALERAGGFAAARSAVLDDVALVRAVKRAGGRGGVVDGSQVASCRMYRSWPELRDGYGKSLWSACGSEPGAVVAMAVLTVAYVVPGVAAAFGSRIGAVGYLAGVGGRWVSARRTGGRALPDALAHPVSIAVLDWLIVRSVVQHRRGVLRWKGRAVRLG